MEAEARRGSPLWLVLVVLGAALLATAGHVLPRAAFKPDDYRYLRQLREAGGAEALFEAMVVENRWDDAWWIPDGTYVRFLRPFVIATFALDRALFGESPRAFLASNLLWHLLAAAALVRCLERLGLPRAAVWTGGLVHALGAARFEQVAYVAGRTDTIAALAFFGALALFLGRRGRRGSAPLVAAAYGAALLAKEYAALLPLLFLAADRWCPAPCERPAERHAERPAAPWRELVARRWRLYLACAGILVLYLAVRAWALGPGGAGARPFPYFHLPPRPGWLEHALAAWLQYGVYLVTGGVGPAFLAGLAELRETAGPIAIALAAVAVPALVAFGLARGGAGRFLAFAFLVTLVPLLGLYTTGRYLALASLGWSGLAGLAVATLLRRNRAAGVALVVALVLPPAIGLHRAIARLPVRPPGGSEADALVELVRESGVPSGPRPLVLIDVSLHWLHLQFLPDVLSVERDAPRRSVWVLTKLAPGAPRVPSRIARTGPAELELSRPGTPLVLPHPWGDFDFRRLEAGDRVREEGYEVTVLESAGGAPTRIRVRFERPLEELEVRALRATPAGPRLVALSGLLPE